MNDSDTRFFIQLLSSALFDRGISAEDIPEHPDWESILQFSAAHTVSVSIACAIEKMPEKFRPAEGIRKKLAGITLANVSAHARLDSVLAYTVKTLRDAGIESVLLKGQGIATYYPTPTMRHCGDIDIYVGKRNFRKACEALCPPGESPEILFENECVHWNTSKKGTSIEVHRISYDPKNLRLKRRYRRFAESQLDNAENSLSMVAAGETVNLPSYLFNAIFVFLHMFKHFIYEGVGLRHICDWVMVLHRAYGNVDRQELERLIRHLRITREWQIFGWLAVNRLGLPKEEMPLYTDKYQRLGEKAFREIMESGNFGKMNKRLLRHTHTESYLRRKIVTMHNISKEYSKKMCFAPTEILTSFISTVFGTGFKKLVRRL